jgi:hypothetical protein
MAAGRCIGRTETRGKVKENQVMLELRKIEQDILATGKVDTHELETLRKRVYSGGKVARPEADFLVELHKRVQHRTPAFDDFFYQAVKDHILRDGQIGAEAAAWLREVVFADGKIDDEERKLLHELRGQARQVSREFEALYEESMKQPQEQPTCG